MKNHSKIFTVWFVFLAAVYATAYAAEPGNSQSQSGNKIEYLDASGAMTKIVVIHDDKRAVTCYVIQEYNNKSISCLPDRDINTKVR